MSAVRSVHVGTGWDYSRPNPERAETLVAALLLMDLGALGWAVGSREGQEGSEQESPEAERSAGHAGKPDRQRETTFLFISRGEKRKLATQGLASEMGKRSLHFLKGGGKCFWNSPSSVPLLCLSLNGGVDVALNC